jgi:hypothetical protein
MEFVHMFTVHLQTNFQKHSCSNFVIWKDKDKLVIAVTFLF